jgi:hypothetical protein
MAQSQFILTHRINGRMVEKQPQTPLLLLFAKAFGRPPTMKVTTDSYLTNIGSTTRRRLLLVACLPILALALHSGAATLYWSGDGTSEGARVRGTQ